MSELKTKPVATSAEEVIASIDDDKRRRDCEVLLDTMKRATGEQPTVWTGGMIGFGTFHYKSSSGREGDWFPVGFANRKAALTVYLGLSLDDLTEPLSRLGKYTTGKGCVYIKRLDDVDMTVLEDLVRQAYTDIKRTYG